MTARVVFDGDTSELSNLRCGVKQGCVMAPTLLGICLSTLFCHTFPSPDKIVLHTRHYRNLFYLAHLRAKTRTRYSLGSQAEFADDAAFCTHCVPKVQ